MSTTNCTFCWSCVVMHTSRKQNTPPPDLKKIIKLWYCIIEEKLKRESCCTLNITHPILNSLLYCSLLYIGSISDDNFYISARVKSAFNTSKMSVQGCHLFAGLCLCSMVMTSLYELGIPCRRSSTRATLSTYPAHSAAIVAYITSIEALYSAQSFGFMIGEHAQWRHMEWVQSINHRHAELKMHNLQH